MPNVCYWPQADDLGVEQVVSCLRYTGRAANAAAKAAHDPKLS